MKGLGFMDFVDHAEMRRMTEHPNSQIDLRPNQQRDRIEHTRFWKPSLTETEEFSLDRNLFYLL